MSSYSYGSCFARWDGQQLEIGNDRFARSWVWREGRLYPVGFQCGGTAWMAEAPGDLAAPTAPGAPQVETEPVLRASEHSGGAVGAPYLAVELEAGGLTFEFKLWEGVAGCAMRLQFPEAHSVAGALILDDHMTSGVEAEGIQNTEESVTGDVQEHFLLPRNRHFRLIHPAFSDQTDAHAELVREHEWLLHPNERDLTLSGNLFVLADVLADAGLVFVKHSPSPHSRPVRSAFDLQVRGKNSLTLRGHGAERIKGDWWAVFAYEGGQFGRIRALRDYQRQWRQYDPNRDGLLLCNTWGDRSRDAHLSPEFMSREVEAAARLGVDVVQIDDGWQQGTTANSALAKQKGGVWNGFWASDEHFWDVNRERFPDGLESLIAQARQHSIRFGLWFGPDSSGEGANWERDAGAILKLHRELGVEFFKIDALKLQSKLSERRAAAFLQEVLRESEGAVTFDQDITAEDRFGYFGLIEPGPLFVENRYTDWGSYWPHQTLRVAWQLARWIDPVRLRLEWLNVTRNVDKYVGDPLAPENWKPDVLFAIVMFFAPLGWFEVQNLPESYFAAAAPLIATWKEHREAIQRGTITPIGSAPDGVSWTGFLSWDGEQGYALVFRELNSSSTWQISLPDPANLKCEVLAGNGSAQVDAGILNVQVDETLGFIWIRLTP